MKLKALTLLAMLAFGIVLLLVLSPKQAYKTDIQRQMVGWHSWTEKGTTFPGVNFYTFDPRHPHVGMVLCEGNGQSPDDFRQNIRQCRIDFCRSFANECLKRPDLDNATDKLFRPELIYFCKFTPGKPSPSLIAVASELFESDGDSDPQTVCSRVLVGTHFDLKTSRYTMLEKHLSSIEKAASESP